MNQITYRWLHIDSGTSGYKSIQIDAVTEGIYVRNYKDALEILNKWNLVGSGKWVYTL